MEIDLSPLLVQKAKNRYGYEADVERAAWTLSKFRREFDADFVVASPLRRRRRRLYRGLPRTMALMQFIRNHPLITVSK